MTTARKFIFRRFVIPPLISLAYCIGFAFEGSGGPLQETADVQQFAPWPIDLPPTVSNTNRWAGIRRPTDSLEQTVLISGTQGSTEQRAGEPNPLQPQDGWFAVLLALLTFVAWIRVTYHNETQQLASAFRQWGFSQQLLREISTGILPGTALLNVFSVVVIGLTFWKISDDLASLFPLHVPLPASLLPAFKPLLVIAATAALALGRYLLLKTLQLLIPYRHWLAVTIYYEFQLMRLAGILLFPLLVIMTFGRAPLSSWALYGSIGLLILMLIVRMLKGLSVWYTVLLRKPIHFLLYLCSLEIAPVLILIRWADMLASSMIQ